MVDVDVVVVVVIVVVVVGVVVVVVLVVVVVEEVCYVCGTSLSLRLLSRLKSGLAWNRATSPPPPPLRTYACVRAAQATHTHSHKRSYKFKHIRVCLCEERSRHLTRQSEWSLAYTSPLYLQQPACRWAGSRHN